MSDNKTKLNNDIIKGDDNKSTFLGIASHLYANGEGVGSMEDGVEEEQTEQLSNCCKAELITESSDEGTGFYRCSQCQQACDILTPDDEKVDSKQENTFDEYIEERLKKNPELRKKLAKAEKELEETDWEKKLRETIEFEIGARGEPMEENESWIVSDPVTRTLTANDIMQIFKSELSKREKQVAENIIEIRKQAGLVLDAASTHLEKQRAESLMRLISEVKTKYD